MLYVAPINPSASIATMRAFEKTCRVAAAAREAVKTAAINKIGRSMESQVALKGTLMTACATIDGRSERVHAKTTPNPTALMNRVATIPAL
jgi:hypothetical protein